MRKRICGALLCFTLAVGSLTPAIPSYAIGDIAEVGASVEASFEASTEESSEESSKLSSDAENEDASLETSSEGAEGNSATDEATEEVSDKASSESSDIQEATDEASVESTATDEAVSEESADEASTEVSDEAASEASEEASFAESATEEISSDGETEGIAYYDYAVKEAVRLGYNDEIPTSTIGFKGNKITPISYYISYRRCTIEFYASKDEDRKNPWKIGEIKDFDYSEDSLTITPADFEEGTYYIFAKYYDSKGKFSEYSPNNLKMVVDAKPEYTITPTDSYGKGGAITVTAEAGKYTKLYCQKRGEKEPQIIEDTDKDGIFEVKDLNTGYFSIYLQGKDTEKPLDIYYAGTEAASITIEGVKSEVTYIGIRDANTRNRVSKGPHYIGEEIPLYISAIGTGNCSSMIAWTTEDEKVAYVNENNFLKFVGEGKTKITATSTIDPSISDSITVEVSGKTIKEATYRPKVFKLDKTKVSCKVGDEVTVKFITDKGLYDFQQKNSQKACIWLLVDDSNVTLNGASMKVAENGEAIINFTVKQPGAYKLWVKSPYVPDKSIEIPVNVNGFINNVVYKDGVIIKGWANVDGAGNLISTGKVDTKAATTYYIDANGNMATGVFKVGKALYLFGTDGKLNVSSVDRDNLISTEDEAKDVYLLSKGGVLLTGWRKVDDKEYYFDPATGKKVVNAWVVKGKNTVFVGADGLVKYASESGIVDGKYCVKAGARYTGFVYVKADELFAKAKDADHVYYFDPSKDGEMATGFFTVAKKRYYADSQGKITLGDKFKVDRDYYVTDMQGVIQAGKLVTARDGKKYYANADGKLLVNAYKAIKGCTYYFGEDGQMCSDGVSSTRTALYVKDANEAVQPVYCKDANSKKIDAGLKFFYDAECTKAVVNSWLYTKEGEEYVEYAYLDKNGKFAVGFVNVNGSRYYMNADGLLNRETGFIVVSGKRYYVENMKVLNTVGFHKIVLQKEGHSPMANFVYVKDTNGTLATGMTTIKVGKESRKYVFDDYGLLQYTPFVTYKSKYYVINSDDEPETVEQAMECYLVSPKKNPMYAGLKTNGDGSLYTGLCTVGGKKYFYSVGTPITGTLIKYGGKIYYFGNDGAACKGWVKISAEDGRFGGMSLTDVDYGSYWDFDEGESFWFYFDPSSCAAYTGWKKMKAPAVDAAGNIKETVDNGVSKIVLTNVTKNLYFAETFTNKIVNGALVCNRDFGIKGKIYRFGPDGSLLSGNNEMVYSEDQEMTEFYLRSCLNKDGTLASGRKAVNVEGRTLYYYFSASGVREEYVIRKSGNKWFYYGRDGHMDYNCKTTGPDNMEVSAQFNSDGSIKCFVDMNGRKLKNCTISISWSGENYYLGNDGFPQTGVVNVDGRKVYIESDGRNIDGPVLEKIGNKIYLIGKGGFFASEGETETIRGKYMYAALPEKDRNAITKLKYSRRKLSEPTGLQIPTARVVANADGSLSAGTHVVDGRVVHTNRYGMILEELGVFYQYGGNWYVGDDIRAMGNGSYELKSYIESIDDMLMLGEKGLIVHWDENYKITSFTESVYGKDTGKPVTGYYTWTYGTQFASRVLMYIKDGKIAAGKQPAPSFYNSSMTFDPDIGFYCNEFRYNY